MREETYHLTQKEMIKLQVIEKALGDKERYSLHEAIDNATGMLLGLYLTKNECLDELGIKVIPAGYPQAKGRIERLWETLQPSFCRARAGRDQGCRASQFSPDYCLRFNERFAVELLCPDSVFAALDHFL